MTSEFFGPLPPSDFNRDDMVRWLDQQVVSFQKIITGSLQADNILSSSNYVAGTSGWMIDGDGNAEFNFVTVRGDVVSGDWDGGTDLSAIDTTATAGFYLDSSAGAGQFSGDMFVTGRLLVRDASAVALLELGGNAGGLGLAGLHWAGLTDAHNFTIYAAGGPSSERLVLEADGSANYIRLFNQTANGITFGIDNVQVAQITGSATTLSNQLLAASGTAGAPGIAFAADTDTGMYRAGSDSIGFATGGTARLTVDSTAIAGTPPFQGPLGSAGAPTFSFANDSNTGWYRHAASRIRVSLGGSDVWQFNPDGHTSIINGSASLPAIRFAATGDPGLYATTNQLSVSVAASESARFVNGGAASSFALRDGLTDVGNHEALRLDRGTGTTIKAVGYFSSWEFDRETGERRKDDIISLSESPRWNRDWFYKLRPVDFRRTATGEREFGFRLEDFVEVSDNLKYLTTKGDRWGFSPHELAIMAAATLEIQNHEQRLRDLEQRLAA